MVRLAPCSRHLPTFARWACALWRVVSYAGDSVGGHAHSWRTMRASLSISRQLELPAPRRDLLATAALLHDIGKATIDPALLRKRSAFSPGEWRVVREHPLRGAHMVRCLFPSVPTLATIVAQHHEWMNGAGYPLGLAGDAIYTEARVVAVADAYDAMVSARPYRAQVSHQDAMAELRRCAGGQFDAQVVDAFARTSSTGALACLQ